MRVLGKIYSKYSRKMLIKNLQKRKAPSQRPTRRANGKFIEGQNVAINFSNKREVSSEDESEEDDEEEQDDGEEEPVSEESSGEEEEPAKPAPKKKNKDKKGKEDPKKSEP